MGLFLESVRLALNGEYDMAVQALCAFLVRGCPPVNDVCTMIRNIHGLTSKEISTYIVQYNNGESEDVYKQLCLFYLEKR